MPETKVRRVHYIQMMWITSTSMLLGPAQLCLSKRPFS